MKLQKWIYENVILLTILAVAFILRVYHVNYQSVWLDEIYTLNESNPDFTISEVYNTLLRSEQTPPLYFFFVHFVFKIFGYTTFILRMFSALLGVAGVFSIYLLGKEILNKKVGLFAAALLAINYFHIFYSQEGRVYVLLFLFTTLSFHVLVRFIKTPNFRWALFYGLSSSLMISCHLFALFALMAQWFFLLIFFIRPYNITRKRFFILCITAGFTAVILYLPLAYRTIKRSMEIESAWIPSPELDVYTQIIKDFFGQSEIVLFFALLLVIVYFLNLFKEKSRRPFSIDPNNDKLAFSFSFLFIWILIVFLIPLIRSYTNVPMLIGRYFTNILPAVIIILAIGLSYVKNDIARYGILIVIVVFSLTDIVVVKSYYTKITKTQFRELSTFILEKNTKREPVVSSLGNFFDYFLNNKKVKTTIIQKSLNEFVETMIKDSTKKAPFWYVDAHGRTYDAGEEVQKYLDHNFVIENSLSVYNGWTHHYSFISETLTKVDCSKYKPLKSSNGDLFRYYVDDFSSDTSTVKLNGWAYFEGQDATETVSDIVLIREEQVFKIQSHTVIRDDVAPFWKIPYNLDNCGFRVNVLTKNLVPGKYQIGVILKNTKTKKEGLQITDYSFTKD